jgi:hypothetical protein
MWATRLTDAWEFGVSIPVEEQEHIPQECLRADPLRLLPHIRLALRQAHQLLVQAVGVAVVDQALVPQVVDHPEGARPAQEHVDRGGDTQPPVRVINRPS